MPDDRTAPEDARPPSAVWERLRNVRGFVFDMDGTLVLGDRRNDGLRPLPGAREITRWLAARGVPFVVCTNGTARTPQRYAAALRDAGFDVSDDAVVTPASSAVDVFLRHGHRRVVVLGKEGVSAPLREAGIETLPATLKPQADAVLVGWHRDFTMDELEAACHAVWGGAELYSCSQSLYFATADGRALGVSRAITSMIVSVTGCRVRVVGKPSLDALRHAGRRLGLRARDLAVVGDDPELEVPMAHRGRSLAVAVTTGIGSAGAYAHLPEKRWPHVTVQGVGELLSLYQQARGD